MSYDQNVKTLNTFDVNRLKETTEFLGEDSAGVMKEKLIFLIMNGIKNKLSYKCEHCGKQVIYDKSYIDQPKGISYKANMCKTATKVKE